MASEPHRRLTRTDGSICFTTFSAFGFETIQLLEQGELRLALISIAANLLLSLGAVWLGLFLVRAAA